MLSHTKLTKIDAVFRNHCFQGQTKILKGPISFKHLFPELNDFQTLQITIKF